MSNVTEILKKIEKMPARSAWAKGVKVYALELLEDWAERHPVEQVPTEKQLLNGAENWKKYSWGGYSIIYNADIAKRLCTPSELKRTKNGEKRPNAREEWLDVQARALYQASLLVLGNTLRQQKGNESCFLKKTL